MALKIPSTLKLTQLKQLAFKCGISSSGTKPVLTQRLHDEILKSNSQHVSNPKSALKEKKKEPVRILSIDMGIRNLAYCILDVPSSKSELPIIQTWHRIAVSSAPSALPLHTTTSTSTSTDPLERSSIITPIQKESFDPATLSSIAYTLLHTHLLPYSPTHILIERQRFRSMGSKHILEWTIRVNMFESILHAILHTLKKEGVWKGCVEAITPGKVGPFWVGEVEGEEMDRKVRKTKNAKLRNKGAKVDLVRKWLEVGEMVRLGNEEVENMAKAYREKWNRLPGGRVKGENKEKEKMGKLDDLADSLLQGMAWIQWEENKRIALKFGVEALLDP